MDGCEGKVEGRKGKEMRGEERVGVIRLKCIRRSLLLPPRMSDDNSDF